jgi:hypothetical protein
MLPLLGEITSQVNLADYRECSLTFSLPKMLPLPVRCNYSNSQENLADYWEGSFSFCLPKMLPLPGTITSQVNPADYRECSFISLAKNVAATRYHLER